MSQKKILLVEDNEFNRKIVHDLLARQPYDLLEAHDGEAGERERHQAFFPSTVRSPSIRRAFSSGVPTVMRR